jgi:hypothetical protein
MPPSAPAWTFPAPNSFKIKLGELPVGQLAVGILADQGPAPRFRSAGKPLGAAWRGPSVKSSER